MNKQLQYVIRALLYALGDLRDSIALGYVGAATRDARKLAHFGRIALKIQRKLSHANAKPAGKSEREYLRVLNSHGVMTGFYQIRKSHLSDGNATLNGMRVNTRAIHVRA